MIDHIAARFSLTPKPNPVSLSIEGRPGEGILRRHAAYLKRSQGLGKGLDP